MGERMEHNIIGGCCGVGVEEIKAISVLKKNLND